MARTFLTMARHASEMGALLVEKPITGAKPSGSKKQSEKSCVSFIWNILSILLCAINVWIQFQRKFFILKKFANFIIFNKNYRADSS